ncbi:NfeD family protein [Candidatus Babeliales bacterium]|nr:NfeD family protein [Candidatus Babeliales bacterium]MBP9844298.1 NfeD family protein [Candidatus Babeliales bacterium]
MIYNSTFLWFGLIFFFLFLEMGHPGLLYFLSFSCGAFCALMATLYDLSMGLQLVAFLAGTCVALGFVHFYVKAKKNQLQSPGHRSNLDALIGKKITVFVSKQDSKVWQAHVAGQIWLVKSVHHEPLEDGQQAVIVDVQGCHLRVDKVN